MIVEHGVSCPIGCCPPQSGTYKNRWRDNSRYHLDDRPDYDAECYYEIHPTVAEFLTGLHPCTDEACGREHVDVTESVRGSA
jgi:hypothetical protein